MRKEYDYVSLFGEYEELKRVQDYAFDKYSRSMSEEDFKAFSKAREATMKVYKKIIYFVSVADLVFSNVASLEMGQSMMEDLDDQPIR